MEIQFYFFKKHFSPVACLTLFSPILSEAAEIFLFLFQFPPNEDLESPVLFFYVFLPFGGLFFAKHPGLHDAHLQTKASVFLAQQSILPT